MSCVLTLGADYLVRGAVAVANRAHLPEGLVGLTIVVCGTSAPALILLRTLSGPMGCGNIAGSLRALHRPAVHRGTASAELVMGGPGRHCKKKRACGRDEACG